MLNNWVCKQLPGSGYGKPLTDVYNTYFKLWFVTLTALFFFTFIFIFTSCLVRFFKRKLHFE